MENITQTMRLKEVLEKMRGADKVVIQDKGDIIFCGDVNKCRFRKALAGREVEDFYPEMFRSLTVNLKPE